MTLITLFTQERPGAGLAHIDVCRVKGAVGPLRIFMEETKQDIPLDWRQPLSAPVYQKNTPAAGKADLLLMVAGQEVNLAKCAGALALLTVLSAGATIYWLVAGRCTGIKEFSGGAQALSEIVGRCTEYELPPQID
jgi:hypothetical protein